MGGWDLATITHFSYGITIMFGLCLVKELVYDVVSLSFFFWDDGAL